MLMTTIKEASPPACGARCTDRYKLFDNIHIAQPLGRLTSAANPARALQVISALQDSILVEKPLGLLDTNSKAGLSTLAKRALETWSCGGDDVGGKKNPPLHATRAQDGHLVAVFNLLWDICAQEGIQHPPPLSRITSAVFRG